MNAQMTNVRMTKQMPGEREMLGGASLRFVIWTFVIHSSFEFRHSNFLMLQHQAKSSLKLTPGHAVFTAALIHAFRLVSVG
jgi:hypothetical protein